MDFALLLRGIAEAGVARIDRPTVRRADARDLFEGRIRYFFLICREDPAFLDVAIVFTEAGYVYVGKRFLGEPFTLMRRALNGFAGEQTAMLKRQMAYPDMKTPLIFILFLLICFTTGAAYSGQDAPMDSAIASEH
jgi:hypothetical protein